MSIKALAHVCIKSTDLDKTAEFYCGALGLTRQFDFVRKGEVIGFYMKTQNETFVEVFRETEIAKIGKQVLNHFCLETDDLQALREKLVAQGYAPREIKMGADHTAQFWMTDPNGMELEFQEYTERSCQRTGQAVEVNW